MSSITKYRTTAVLAAKEAILTAGDDLTRAQRALILREDLWEALMRLGAYHAVEEAKRSITGAAFASSSEERQERARTNEAHSSARFREAAESRFMDRVRLWNGETLARATVPVLVEQVQINQTLADGNAARAKFYCAVLDRLVISEKQCVKDALCDEELLIIRDETKADL